MEEPADQDHGGGNAAAARQGPLRVYALGVGGDPAIPVIADYSRVPTPEEVALQRQLKAVQELLGELLQRAEEQVPRRAKGPQEETSELIAKVKAMRADGKTWRDIDQHFSETANYAPGSVERIYRRYRSGRPST